MSYVHCRVCKHCGVLGKLNPDYCVLILCSLLHLHYFVHSWERIWLITNLSFTVVLKTLSGYCMESRLPVVVVPRFESPVGPTFRIKSAKTPLEVLQLFLTMVLLQSIVFMHQRFAKCKGVTLNLLVEEMQAFIGMNIAMGMLRLPQVRDY